MEGKFSNNQMWRLKRKIMPRPREPPTAKKNEEGNVVTHPVKLRNLYLNTYKHRLRQRQILPHLKHLRKLRVELFQLRMEKARNKKTKDWSELELGKVLDKL